jgi:alpha-1,2-mannosyltransferase
MVRAVGAEAGEGQRAGWLKPLCLVSAVAWAGALVWLLVSLVVLSKDTDMIDLLVYRIGGLAWLKGIPLYGHDFPGVLAHAPYDAPPLPFTYPPIAAVIFSVIGLLPIWGAKAVLTVASLVALTATMLVTIPKLAANRIVDRTLPVLPFAALAGMISVRLFEPTFSTFKFGQINILLMALVAIDCLAARNPKLRGVLTGLAAAIKLTPAVFVLYFLVRKDWRAVVTTIASLVFFGLLGLVLDASDTINYWFDALLDPSRIGGLAFANNQSLRGVLHRIPALASFESPLWLLLALAVVALAAIGARRAVVAGNQVAALSTIAIAGLLISPVSWSHHWVWVAPLVLMLAWSLWHARAWRLLPLLLVVVAIFYLAMFDWLPKEHDTEMGWNLWQHLVGDSYVWCGLAFVVVTAFFWRHRSPANLVEKENYR